MLNQQDEPKQQVADFMNRLYERGLTTASGGNISLRTTAGQILITPSGSDKGRMDAAQIAELELDGTNRTPSLKPSIETGMHLEIYRNHPHVQAIVHAHPPHASSFAVSTVPLDITLIAESYFILGQPALASYALQGTNQLAANVCAAINQQTHCVLMQNHGVLTVGASLLQAFDRMEVLENTARINLYARQLGHIRALSKDEQTNLDEWIGTYG